MIIPGASVVPANKLPENIVLAPAAMALETSPGYLIPPSAQTGTLYY